VTPTSATAGDRYRVQTPTAIARAIGTEFTTQYVQTGTAGSTVISVQTGTVDVTTRQGQIIRLTSGTQQSFDDLVARVSLLLPVDRGTVTRGSTNTFSWTSFAGAAAYLFEFTLSPSGFAQANPTAPEAGTIVAPIGSAFFTTTAGSVEIRIPVAASLAPAGTRVQWRVYPANAAGQVLTGTRASDASTAILQ
jgi:hypothetical protein